MELDGREHGRVRLPERAGDLRAAARERADHVRRDDASGRQPVAHQLRELESRHVEGNAVRVEGVDHDHVEPLVGSLQEPPPVVDHDGQPRVARQVEPPVRDVDDRRVELDRRHVDVAEVAPDPFLHGRAAEPDDEDLLRARVVGEPELQVVAVREARGERPLQVHPALERAVEAEVARRAVLDDEQAVVARVACLADREAFPAEADLGRVELAGRPHLALAIEG